MTRFDLIFLIRDVRDAQRDLQIAKHVIDLHSTGKTVKRQEHNSAEVQLNLESDVLVAEEIQEEELGDEDGEAAAAMPQVSARAAGSDGDRGLGLCVVQYCFC